MSRVVPPIDTVHEKYMMTDYANLLRTVPVESSAVTPAATGGGVNFKRFRKVKDISGRCV